MTKANPSNALRLFLLGFVTLFLELALIRFLAGNIFNLGYFPNLVLLAVFVGMGIGFVFHWRVPDESSPRLLTGALWLLLALILMVHFLRPVVPGFSGPGVDIGGEIFFSGEPPQSRANPVFLFLLLFSGIVFLFALLSQRTAKYFKLFRPLSAYSLDIGGSCCGILTFVAISWLKLPAFTWFLVLIPALCFIQWNARQLSRWSPVFLFVAVSFVAWKQDARLLGSEGYAGNFEVHWSPYQKVEFAPESNWPLVFVNGILHQSIVPLDQDVRQTYYYLPYRFRAEQTGVQPYRNVLILGSGSGNDVTAAIEGGAESIDAVEIDPVIADLAVRHNPARPYQDERVRLVVDDGRSFLSYTERKYDLIVFALTDSLVKASPVSQLRLENYLFTEESVRKAFERLTDDGYLVFYNFYRFPFVVEKIEKMIYISTDKHPLRIFSSGDFAMILVGRRFQAKEPSVYDPELEIPRDDWPFLYLEKSGIPPLYAKAMLIVFLGIVVLAGFVQRSADERGEGADLSVRLAFLLMGVAFLLLEAKSVIQFSLLFGTTWLNNSLVFLAVLLSVLLANWTAIALKGRGLMVAYVLLIAFCLLGLVLPLNRLLGVENLFWRFVLAGVLTFSPIYFANFVFSVTFQKCTLAEQVFGWNLIGAALGGVLEYTSMWVGYNSLAAVVAVCYSAVVLILARQRPVLAVQRDSG